MAKESKQVDAGAKPDTNKPREDAKVVAPREPAPVVEPKKDENPLDALAREQREKATKPPGLEGIASGSGMAVVPPQS